MAKDTDLTSRIGVNLVESIMLDFGWVFREQSVSDEGVDAQVETKIDGKTSGRLLALQIKTGPSYFKEPKDDGWIFRFKERKARLWLDHALPAIVVFVDPKSRIAYWQRVSPETVTSTGKGYKVHIPRTNTVATARDTWDHFSTGIELKAAERFDVAMAVLPPASAKLIREMHEEHPSNAQVLALHLAEGRRSPGPTTDALILAEPVWLQTDSGIGWRAVAAYAAEHEQPRSSADALELAAKTNVELKGRLLAAAGVNVMRDDPARASALLDQAASDPQAELTVRIGRALLAHPSNDARPRDVVPALDPVEDRVHNSAMVQAFLAEQCVRNHDLQTALTHARRARELDPEDTSYMLTLADVLGRRSFQTSAGRGDLVEASTLLRDAVDQRHRWDGPTVGPLEDLLRTFALLGDNEGVLRYGLTPPHGVARPEEAQRPYSLRHTIFAAYSLSLQELVEDLGPRLGKSARDTLDRARVGLIDLPQDQEISLWLKVASDAERKNNYAELTSAILHLGSLGRDESARLDDLVAVSIVPSTARDLARTLSKACTDFDAALPELRALARTDIASAEHLLRLLAEQGRYDEAVKAAKLAHELFKQDYFLIAEAQLLIEAKNWDTAEEAAKRAIATSDFPRQRGLLLTFLAGRAADRGDWAIAEDYLARVLPLHSQTRSEDVWRLVQAQLHRAEALRAADTIRKYSPNVETAQEARLWLQAMLSERWDEIVASEAIGLAHKFETDTELSLALLAQVIHGTSTSNPAPPSSESEEDEHPVEKHDTRPQVPADLHRQAFEALEQHLQGNPNASAIRKIQGTTEQLLEEMTKILKGQRERREALTKLLEQVQQGSLPLGLLATASAGSYALALVQQYTGPLIAASAQDDEHDLEQSTAAASLNQVAVMDASSLLLTSQLPKGKQLRGRLESLLLPNHSRRDILRAAVEVQGLGGSPGSLNWDESEQKPTFSVLTADAYMRFQRRVEALNDAAREVDVRPVEKITLFDELEELHESFADLAWLGPIELAHQLSAPLWSDDLGLRRLARSVGVAAFGTPALVDAVNQQAIDAVPEGDDEEELIQDLLTERQTWVRSFAKEYVVDVPAHLEDVLALAESENWRPDAAATLLTRPSWWSWQKDAYGDWDAILQAVDRNRPEARTLWQQAAMIGVSRTYQDSNYSAAMLAVIALIGLRDKAAVDDAVEGIRIARSLRTERDLPDPALHLATAARALVRKGQLTNPQSLIESVLATLAANDDVLFEETADNVEGTNGAAESE